MRQKFVTLWLATLVLFAPTLSPAWYRASLLDCKARDYASMTHGGTLDSSRRDYWLNAEQFIIDLDTGMVRHKIGKGQVWQIVQKGSAVNDTVLIPLSFGAPRKTVGPNIADDVIRIRDWEQQKEIIFWKTGLTSVTTGICTVLR